MNSFSAIRYSQRETRFPESWAVSFGFRNTIASSVPTSGRTTGSAANEFHKIRRIALLTAARTIGLLMPLRIATARHRRVALPSSRGSLSRQAQPWEDGCVTGCGDRTMRHGHVRETDMTTGPALRDTDPGASTCD